MLQTSGVLNLFGDLTEYPKEPVEAARFLWGRGFKVIPFRIESKRLKRPVVTNWRPYTLKWPEIEAAVTEFGSFGIVVPRGTVVIDLDCEDAEDSEYCKFVGLDSLIEISEKCGDHNLDFLNTITTDTPSGGMHLWYRVPPHIKFKNSASRIGKGIDIRVADKGLVVMPPSYNHEGRQYEFNNYSGSQGASRAPSWLIQTVSSASTPPKLMVEGDASMFKLDSSEKIESYLDRMATEIATSPHGARNNTLNAVAYGVYRRAASGIIPEGKATFMLEQAALQSGLPDKEILATLQSARRAASQNPSPRVD